METDTELSRVLKAMLAERHGIVVLEFVHTVMSIMGADYFFRSFIYGGLTVERGAGLAEKLEVFGKHWLHIMDPCLIMEVMKKDSHGRQRL